MKYYLWESDGKVVRYRYRESEEGGLEYFVSGDNWSASHYESIEELMAETSRSCVREVAL